MKNRVFPARRNFGDEEFRGQIAQPPTETQSEAGHFGLLRTENRFQAGPPCRHVSGEMLESDPWRTDGFS
jgi:hypothetical protein